MQSLPASSSRFTPSVIPDALVALLLALSSAAQSAPRTISTLPVTTGTAITDRQLVTMVNEKITSHQSTLLVFTQCYGGNMAFHFSSSGRPRTQTISAGGVNRRTYYRGFHDDAARGLHPGHERTGDNVFDDGDAGRDAAESPINANSYVASLEDTSATGAVKSRHVLVYAGRPEPLDEADRQAIENNFAGKLNTTVTTVGSTGTAPWNYPASRKGLLDALSSISQAMTDDEQFILFVTDHGDLHQAGSGVVIDPGSRDVAVSVPQSMIADMLDDAQNEPEAGVSILVAEGAVIDPLSLLVSVGGSPTYGVTSVDIMDSNGDGDLDDPDEGQLLFFNIPEGDLLPSGTNDPEVQTITVTNLGTDPVDAEYVSLDSGAIRRVGDGVPVRMSRFAVE